MDRTQGSHLARLDQNIDWFERLVQVDHSKKQVKDSPEWDTTAPVNKEYEEQLYDYYGRRVYWP
ncbi:MAG: hypothetical protein ACT4OM_07945 [Actinomycetota bacterium]